MKNDNDEIKWILGNENVKVCPIPPYSDIVIKFLDELSNKLRRIPASKGYPDIISLAFWCRKSNVMKLKENANDISNSLGRGLVFHITPSNVPINFAFSYFFGLLSGNSNIVRIPSKDYPQIKIICEAISELLSNPEYEIIKNGTAFVKYGHNKNITDIFSLKSDYRIIWGGDFAINTIRQSPLKAKGAEIVFADRYSIGILNGDAVLNLSEEEVKNLAKNFYNDTYLMDQNACSSPHILLWTGQNSNKAKRLFWESVYEEAKKYDLEPIKAVDKYTDLCMLSMTDNLNISKITRYENILYTIDIKKLPDDICSLKGKFGMFYQCNIENIDILKNHITEKVQTLLYYGEEKQDLCDFVINNNLTGIDRIVPFGNALDMNVYWDGYDIIRQLSRKIIFE